MSDVITLSFDLVKATGIRQFRSHGNGRRIISMPYWRRLNGGPWVFEFISEETDADLLAAEIDAGEIYIRQEDADRKTVPFPEDDELKSVM